MSKVFIVLLARFVICNFCQKDLLVLKRHLWRCKSKTSTVEHNQNNGNLRASLFDNAAINVIDNTSGNTSNSSDLNCAHAEIRAMS